MIRRPYRVLVGCMLLGTLASSARAQQSAVPDTTAADSSVAPAAVAPKSPAAVPVAPAKTVASKKPSPFYYGGSVGLSFWGGISRINVQPMVGYKLTPKLSLGGKVAYEHLRDTRFGNDITSDNWGTSVFGRLKLLRTTYAHVEYANWWYDEGNSSRRVPYLLVGGGVVKPLAPGVSMSAEVLFDVLRDDHSRFEDREPWLTVGVGVGF